MQERSQPSLEELENFDTSERPTNDITAVSATNPSLNGQVLVSFVDAGAIWNSSSRKNPDSNVLAGAGLGLLWQQGDRFRARFDWGIPLVDLDSQKRTWQEHGLYFNLEYNFF